MEAQSSFIKWFDILRVVKSPHSTSDDILQRLQSRLSDKEVKHILYNGIRACREQLPQTVTILDLSLIHI